MSVLDVMPKQTERAWAQSLDRLAALFQWAKWQDRATNMPRACKRCKAPIQWPRNDPGWPDRVYVRGDRLIFVELKTDRGRLSDDQKVWLGRLSAVRRVEVYIARPRDAERMKDVFR